MKTVYMAGPIFGCSDSVAQDWRNDLVARYGEIKWIDPMRRDYRGMEGDYDAEIVVLDKLDIDQCNAVLVYFEQPSVGTSMEILYAWMRGIPVVIVTEQEKLSPWLTYHATLIVRTFKEAVDFIRRVPFSSVFHQRIQHTSTRF